MNHLSNSLNEHLLKMEPDLLYKYCIWVSLPFFCFETFIMFGLHKGFIFFFLKTSNFSSFTILGNILLSLIRGAISCINLNKLLMITLSFPYWRNIVGSLISGVNLTPQWKKSKCNLLCIAIVVKKELLPFVFQVLSILADKLPKHLLYESLFNREAT